MSDHDDELDPNLVAALRDVPVADAATVDSQVAGALDHLGSVRTGTGPARRWLSVAAAVVVLLAGFGLGRVDGGSDDRTRNAAVDAATTTIAPKGAANCPLPDGGRVIGEYRTEAGERTIILTETEILVVDAVTCETVQRVPLP